MIAIVSTDDPFLGAETRATINPDWVLIYFNFIVWVIFLLIYFNIGFNHIIREKIRILSTMLSLAMQRCCIDKKEKDLESNI